VYEALEQARCTIRADPKYPNPHAPLGGLLQRTGDTTGARAALTEAVRLDPRNPQWKALLAGLPPPPVAPVPREKK
jgi:cytochrome c-type biogenesis protein CcmH/NrfG